MPMDVRTLLNRVFVLKRTESSERTTPPRALFLSLLALLVAAGAALFRPEVLAAEWGLIWVLALVPCFLFSYYRGIRGAALALALGMVAITVSEVLGTIVVRHQMDWWVYASASTALIVVSLGMGVTTELLQRAGGDPYVADHRWQTGRQLLRALREEELAVFYQPIVDLTTGDVRGAEALVRWRHPESGLLLPEAFLPTAEATDLIGPLGERVLRTAVGDLPRCREHFSAGDDFFLSVNLSPTECEDPEALQDRVVRALAEGEVEPGALQFEITEKYLLETTEGIEALRELGAAVAIDDFGIEYASLNYLHWLETEALKLSRSFLTDVAGNQRAAIVVRSTIRLAERLAMDVTAEGIETPEQRDTLRRLGCHLGQGFYFGRPGPLPAADAAAPAGA